MRLIHRWLTGGLLGLLVTLTARAEELAETPISDSDRQHWSFRPLARPAVPIATEAGTANPVDSFLEERLRTRGLFALGRADRLTLLRRMTFDLTGLPPTVDEMAAFLSDSTPDACERVVDRLLASPGYGERWGQHWLDLARFAETDGFEFDAVRPNAWRYRDWVIAALNDDLPFEQFLQYQIAGDELRPDDPEAVIATGFLLCGPDMPDINDQDERRHTVLNELTGTIGSSLLGLSVGCAQCHDHKLDPISQLDFYRLRAFFDQGELFKDHPVATLDERAAQQTARRVAAPLEKQIKLLDDVARQRLREQNPDQQPTADELRDALTADERSRREVLSDELAQLPKTPDLPFGRVFKNGSERTSVVAIRGDFRRAGPTVQPAFLRIVDLANARAESRLSRSDLARWLTRPDHPLVWRVMVNRLWQFHFGEGLSRSPSDFGFGGSEPTHAVLLDWLASELARDSGGLKRMHRLLMTSAAYRRTSRPEPGKLARINWESLRSSDPDNRWWGRMTPRRLEGEAIRDAMLSAAGVLSDRRGGPGVRPPLPQELVATLLRNQWIVSTNAEDHRRRSIHLMVRRNLRDPLFEVFDRPDTNATCPKRSRSIVAPQALALLNSELSLSLAERLRERVTREATVTSEQISRIFQLTLGRPPAKEEHSWAFAFINMEDPTPQTVATTAGQMSPMSRLCLALFNTTEFQYVD